MTVAIVVTAVASLATTAAAAEVPVTGAPALTWGFKASWRSYAGTPAVADGASVVADDEAPFDLDWPFVEGTYDPDARTTRLRYGGTVHWQKYRASELGVPAPPGYDGADPDPYLLDVELSDPEVTISRDSSAITAVATSRDKDTWELVSYGRVPIVDLDVSGAQVVVAGGTTEWSAIHATVAGEGVDVFDGGYVAGRVVDQVAFAYTGDGGAPDLSESWDAPGTVKLALAQNELVIQGDQLVDLTTPWIDRDRLLVHSQQGLEVDGVFSARFRAFDLEAMTPVGQPLTIPATDAPGVIMAIDENQQRILYRGPRETGTTRWLSFDPEEGYEAGLLSHPLTVGRQMAWDAHRNRGYFVERVVPPGVGASDFDAHVWQLTTYAPQPDGTWVTRSFPLPGFGSGQNRTGYSLSHNNGSHRPAYATASDGSIIVLSAVRTSTDPNNPVPATIPGAYRLVLDDEDQAVTVAPIAGTEVPNTAAGVFSSVVTGADGRAALLQSNDGTVQQLRIGPSGSVTVDQPVVLSAHGESGPYDGSQLAIDPVDGTLWFGGYTSQRLVAIQDGRIVGAQHVAEWNPRGNRPVLVGPDQTVYAQTNDGSPQTVGGSLTWGYGRLERLGTSPTVTTDPVAAAVALGPGETSEDVAFSSSATGAPEPAQQWQVKAPGSSRFVDLAGETAATLTVAATPGADGREYRAVYENAAGRIASEPAGLTVEHAPLVAFQPVDVAVIEGADAAFDVVASGNPEPEVTWQRYAAGFWWNIGPDDDGLVLSEGRLTVTDANLDQDGTRVRARIRNDLGTTYSRVATLAVEEQADGTRYVVDGELDWGVRQSFRTYITGPIAHGAIAVADGAVTNEDGTFGFPATDGTVDGDAVEATFGGSVRFTGHVGLGTPPGVPALDMRVSDIRVDVDGQDGTLVADVVSRGLSSGSLVTYDDVVFATLDLSAVSPTPVEGGLRWTAVPATLTAAGVPAFADFYPAGSDLDPLTVTLVLSDEEEPSLTPVEAFATAALTDFLGAAPTAEQVAAAVDAVGTGGRAAFLRSLSTSDGWLAAVVQDLYQDTLGREASEADVEFWAGRIRAGWTIARVAASFYAAAEYYDGIGGGTDATWVADLYTTLLGRPGSPAEVEYWVGETVAKGRGNVALRFFQTPESARTRVTALYDDLLGRTPTTGDLTYWAPVVVARGDLTLAVTLAASAEYQTRAEARFP